jgi:hypothetical protein
MPDDTVSRRVEVLSDMVATITVNEDEVLATSTIAIHKTKGNRRWEVYEVPASLGICVYTEQIGDTFHRRMQVQHQRQSRLYDWDAQTM